MITAARRMWRMIEPVHAVTYFAPASGAALARCGLKGFWMSYFAARSAPMGPVGPAVVEATFYNFAPKLVRRAIPDAWTFATPDAVLEARLAGARDSLLGVLGDLARAPELKSLAALARQALDGLDCAGRPLGAANRELPSPDDPVASLWSSATVLREHRG
ncbi:MAG: SCO6745 family protein, partial [Acidimicrobiales bacterium]